MSAHGGRQWNQGDRVYLAEKGGGTIAYIGEPHFASGIWYGVVLDEPKGKNNGTVKGVSYFTCEANCGVFVRENQVRRVKLFL